MRTRGDASTASSSSRDDRGIVTHRTPAPRYFKLSYLVTAWTQRPDDEHRLLDALLRCFLRFDAIPDASSSERSPRRALPCSLTVALPPPEDRAFADVWSSLGGELKPSLDVVVTAPDRARHLYPAGPPVTAGVEAEFSATGLGIDEGAVRAALPRHRPQPPRVGGLT